MKKNLIIECIVSRCSDCSIPAYEVHLIHPHKNFATNNSISCKNILLKRRIFLSSWAFEAHWLHFSINKWIFHKLYVTSIAVHTLTSQTPLLAFETCRLGLAIADSVSSKIPRNWKQDWHVNCYALPQNYNTDVRLFSNRNVLVYPSVHKSLLRLRHRPLSTTSHLKHRLLIRQRMPRNAATTNNRKVHHGKCAATCNPSIILD